MNGKKQKRKNVFKKRVDLACKKILPQNSKCESKYISSSRLTRPIGLYNQGKISYLVSRCDEIASPRMKARVQEDLHKILNLTRDQNSINKDGQRKDSVKSSHHDNVFAGALNRSENGAHHNNFSNLPSSALKSPTEMDVDDVLPEPSHSSTATIPIAVNLQDESSPEIVRPSSSKKSSNRNSPFSFSSKAQSLDGKMNPEISDFIDLYVSIWASHLQREDQQDTKDTNQNKTPNNIGCSKQSWIASSSSSSSHTATKATQHTITLSSSDESPFEWSLNETGDSLPLGELSNMQQTSDQDIEYRSPLNYRHAFENCSLSSEAISSSNDYETPSCWSPINDDELTNFIENEENFLRLDRNTTMFSPHSPPKISPLKRPCLKVETPKLFFRHKMY